MPKVIAFGVLLLLTAAAAAQEVSRATLRKLCEIDELKELGSGEADTDDFEPAAVVYEVMTKRLEKLETHISTLEQRLEEVPDAKDIEAMATAIRSELIHHINESFTRTIDRRMQLLTTEIRDSVESVLVSVVSNFAESGTAVIPPIELMSTTLPATTTPKVHSDCDSYADSDDTSGIFDITIKDTTIDVLCEFNKAPEESWLVIQRRFDGSQDFYKGWQEYKDGFGSLSKEFYLGNENIHKITTYKPHTLKVELYDQFGDFAYALFSNFSISDEEDGYRLNFRHYSGTAGNALKASKGKQFSTFDRDNDGSQLYSCARLHRGGFWYDRCGSANLNGVFQQYTAYAFNWQNIIWYTWKRNIRPMTRVKMSIKVEDL